jgi:Xaa-Pro aminopeptidase
MFDFAARCDRARGLMGERGIDAMLFSVGSDLPYLTGYTAMPTERLTMLVLPRLGDATLVVPRLEAPRVEERPGVFSIRAWDETEDPIAITAGLCAGSDTLAVGEQTWAVFVIGLQRGLDASFRSAAPVMRELRMRKEDAEIDLLRRAAHAADAVVPRLDTMTFAGRTERDLAREIERMLMEEGHDTAEFAIVASGPNAASPHHEPGSREMAAGDTVVLDFGGMIGGYHSDTTRTFVVGAPSARVAEAFAVLQEAQEVGRETAAPGIAAEQVDRATRAVIEDAGWGEFFVHRTGHGIGLDVHEHPYLVEGNDLALEEGMTFSVEPGIYVPGEFGMRIEDIVAVTADGAESLNRSDRSLHRVA